MGGIEWGETVEYQVPSCTLGEFVQSKGLSGSVVGNKRGLLAFVAQQALDDLHVFLVSDLRREHGGVLVGQPFRDPNIGCYFTLIRAAVAAPATRGSPVHLEFTAEAWEHLSVAIEMDHPDCLIVGWFHSHPGLGVFMSSTDRATQRAFFNHPWNVAVVADPLNRRTGWFSGESCSPMDDEQVVVLAEIMARERTLAPTPDGEPAAPGSARHRPLDGLRWLLPIGVAAMLLTAAMLQRRGRGGRASRKSRTATR